jgi:hypothetical protein
MNIYDVSGCKVDIVRPGKNLVQYGAEKKPYALINASLYNGISFTKPSTSPIGTIIEHGDIVHNDGNGYGFGVINYEPKFGKPWDHAWDEYLTGYNSPVQNGDYVAPSHNDMYVFDCKLSRIGIGSRNGRLVIATDDNVTLKGFAKNAIKQGLDTLVNLDGGGSRHLLYNGRAIYQSYRVPYNAIIFYNDIVIDEQNPYSEPLRNIYWGCWGEDVKWVQWMLNKKNGSTLKIDGLCYSATVTEIIKFQKTFTNFPDGICGPNTRRELKK